MISLNLRVVALALLVLFAFATITNMVMAFNVQLPGRVVTLGAVGYSDNTGYQPMGDPVDGEGSPK